MMMMVCTMPPHKAYQCLAGQVFAKLGPHLPRIAVRHGDLIGDKCPACFRACTPAPKYLAPDHPVWRALLQCLGAIDVGHALAKVEVSFLARHHAIYLQQRSMVLLCPLVPEGSGMVGSRLQSYSRTRSCKATTLLQLAACTHLRYPSTLPPMYSLL